MLAAVVPASWRPRPTRCGAYAEHRPSCLLEGHPELEPLIDAAERRNGLPPGLLRALVEVESETRVHRISPAGAMGPGQLMPSTATMLGVEDPFDPAPAVDASARYLAEQLRRFRGDVRLAVAAYNAGPGRGERPGASQRRDGVLRAQGDGGVEAHAAGVTARGRHGPLRERPPPPR
ncbi:lytic transglycosylase domain-containing protein [Pyxidicoccus sp. 3LFB2]